MRVTGGTLGGRRLHTPRNRSVRPTSDRVREALFARLERDSALVGGRVLDLFAGSGALGIEALSRGAREVVFVERAGPVAQVIRQNLASLGLDSEARVIRGDARRTLERLRAREEPFDLVLLDPPYDSDLLDPCLERLADAELLSEAGLVVVETSRRNPPRMVTGLDLLDARRYGDTVVSRFGRLPGRVREPRSPAAS